MCWLKQNIYKQKWIFKLKHHKTIQKRPLNTRKLLYWMKCIYKKLSNSKCRTKYCEQILKIYWVWATCRFLFISFISAASGPMTKNLEIIAEVLTGHREPVPWVRPCAYTKTNKTLTKDKQTHTYHTILYIIYLKKISWIHANKSSLPNFSHNSVGAVASPSAYLQC